MNKEAVLLLLVVIVVIGCLPLLFKSQSKCDKRFVIRGRGFKEDAEEMLKKLSDWDDAL